MTRDSHLLLTGIHMYRPLQFQQHSKNYRSVRAPCEVHPGSVELRIVAVEGPMQHR